ncbi:MAG: HAD-IA family hydrolase [Acidiferrobacterales bacterium]|nr:HAD-IA family hydrolase [Acidiferrobacterales bacterium]
MTQYPHITSVLFDVDGLLLDTESIYTEVTQSIVSEFGKTFDWSIKANMIGRAEMESSRYLVEALELPISAEEYLERRNDMLKAGFATCRAMPGAEALIRHLDSRSVPIAVATSSTRELFNIKKSGHTSWFDLFEHTVTGDDPQVKQAKPAPDIFLTAGMKIDAVPENTLIFEDAPSGLAAGEAAGMHVVAVPDPNMDKARYDSAVMILDSLESFDPGLFGLPSF